MAVRRALAFSSAERYVNLLINFGLIAAVSRLLTPQEIGVSALGVTILGLVEVVRDIPSSYLVQRPTLTREDIRTAFTAMFIISLILAGALAAAAPSLAAFYNDPGITLFLQLFAIAFLAGPIERPLMALFRRDMNFGAYAIINVATVVVNAAVTITLVLLGYSYLSFAYAAIAAGLTSSLMALYFKPDFWIFKPMLSEWRQALYFGGYTSAWAIITRSSDMLLYLILGRLHGFEATGFYNRTMTMASTPDRLILSGLTNVILPAFASEVRAGRPLKDPFLLAASYVTAVYWPAFLLLSVLAYPAVAILLGSQWTAIVPLVQIAAIACLFNFTGILNFPAMMAIGALRSLLMTALIAVPITAVIACLAASVSVEMLIYSMLVTIPIQMAITLIIMKSHIAFTWKELREALKPSAVLAAFTIALPLVWLAYRGFAFDMPILTGVGVGVSGVIGWFAGVWVINHPLRREILMIAQQVRRRISPDALKPGE